MLRWLSVGLLLRSAQETVVSGWFGKFADKRELQDWRQPVFSHDQSETLWLDFVSDTGDGFDSTHSIASLLARPSLEAGDEALERAGVIVFGGDEVYPSASTQNYLDHFIGPYTAALPHSEPESEAPYMYATPGNHDWYDGLTAFLRLFAQDRWIGGWRTRQKRSYFALRLPSPWWLWAVDIQFDTEIDPVQIRYFRELAAKEGIGAGDKLILVTAKPSWVTTGHEPDSYRNLAYIERELIPAGADLVATLTGDVHHYAHYEAHEATPAPVPRHRITAGGGGAYVSSTHTLPERVLLSRRPWRPTSETESDAYDRGVVYPEIDDSQKLAAGAVLAPVKTWSFAAFLGVVYAFVAGSMLAGLDGSGRDLAGERPWLDVFTESAGLRSLAMFLVLLAGLWVFADFKSKFVKVAVVPFHTAAHIAVTTTSVWGATAVVPGDWSDTPLWAVTVAAAFSTGAVAGSLVIGLYLYLAQLLSGANSPGHTNQAFAAQGLDVRKCFLRLRIERDGPATVYAIGLHEPCRDWRVADDPSGRPVIEPSDAAAPRPHLIEKFVL